MKTSFCPECGAYNWWSLDIFFKHVNRHKPWTCIPEPRFMFCFLSVPFGCSFEDVVSFSTESICVFVRFKAKRDTLDFPLRSNHSISDLLGHCDQSETLWRCVIGLPSLKWNRGTESNKFWFARPTNYCKVFYQFDASFISFVRFKTAPCFPRTSACTEASVARLTSCKQALFLWPSGDF